MQPIVVPHDPAWSMQYLQEAGAIHGALGGTVKALHHIGSTAIPGILAKPVIDILVGVSSLEGVDERVEFMGALGYEAKGAFGLPGRRYFRKTDGRGARTHHVHAYLHESAEFTRHLAFRDYLRAHPAEAQLYSDLKAGLVRDKTLDRKAYQAAKSAFVAAFERDALAWLMR